MSERPDGRAQPGCIVLLHKSVYNCTFDILILRDQDACFCSSLESHRVLTHKSISLKLILFRPSFSTGAWEGDLGTTHSYITEGEFIGIAQWQCWLHERLFLPLNVLWIPLKSYRFNVGNAIAVRQSLNADELKSL
jgi:hypothetical protein